METRADSSGKALGRRVYWKPLLYPCKIETKCAMSQSAKSTQPSPLLECEESIELRKFEEEAELDHSPDSSETASDISVITTTEDPQSSFSAVDRAFLFSLLEKEVEYAANPFALQLQQPYITAMMRAELLDWMMEVCSEFTLKRETYYLAVAYFDRYLSIKPAVQRDTLQLLGLGAMVISAKVEEVSTPKLSDFARSADCGFTVEEIKEMEKNLLKTLSWKVIPPTVFAWVSLGMYLWDCYILSLLSPLPIDNSTILFKHPSQSSYRRYRDTLQVLDAAYLDVDVLRYSPRNIAAGVLYLMLAKFAYETDYALLAQLSPFLTDFDSSLSLYFGDGTSPQQAQGVQTLFSDFTSKALEIPSIEDIYPSVAFLNPYIEFSPPLSLPAACTLLPLERIESHYEDFLAFQTHSDGSVEFVARKIRSL